MNQDRELAIKIYQLFETSNDRRARENFDLYDQDPRNLDRAFRFLVKQSYAAVELCRKSKAERSA